MSIFKHECYKLYSKPFSVIAVLVVLLLNAGLSMNISDESRSINEVYRSLSAMSNLDKLSTLETTINEIDSLLEIDWEQLVGEETSVYEYPDALQDYYPKQIYVTVYNEIKQAVHYNSFIDDIVSEAAHIDDFTLFSDPDSFDYKQIKLAGSVYQELKDTAVAVQSSEGLELALSNSFTIMLLVMLTVLLSVTLGSEDAESKMIWLVKSTKKGRSYRIAAQIVLLFLYSLFINFLVLLSNLAISENRLGLGNLLAPIQSVSLFYTSPLKVNILGYILIHFAFNVLSVFLLAMVSLLIVYKLGHAMLSFFASFIFLVAEYFSYRAIAQNSYLNGLKYINVFSAMDSKTIFSSFRRLNLLNTSVDIPIVLLVCFTLFLLLLAVLLLKQNVHSVRLRNLRIGFAKRQKRYSTSLILNETYKLLITNKVIYVFLLFSIVGLYQLVSYSDTLSKTDLIYKKYIMITEGEVNEDTDTLIDLEEARFEKIAQDRRQLATEYEHGDISQEDYMLAVYALSIWDDYKLAFTQFTSEVVRAKEQGLSTVVYKTGYEKIIGDQARGNYLFLNVLAIVFLVLSIAPFYAYDNSKGMAKIIKPTVNGRMVLVKTKCVIACLSSVIITLISFLPYIVGTLIFYGHTQLNADINAVINFPLHIPIWLYLSGKLLLLALLYSVFSLVISLISIRSKRVITAIGLSGILFILPSIFLVL